MIKWFDEYISQSSEKVKIINNNPKVEKSCITFWTTLRIHLSCSKGKDHWARKEHFIGSVFLNTFWNNGLFPNAWNENTRNRNVTLMTN